MNLPTAEELTHLTPMVRQFYELKSQAPDAILFFRMGDFFEIFGEDAEHVAPILDLALTSRERGDKTRLPFCGVPHHSARGYWLRLLKLGYRVALADQVEDPATAKGLVKREIIQVLTPGCVDELEGLETDKPNHLVGIYEVPANKTWLLAILDVSVGEFRLGSLERHDMGTWIERLQPSECVARRFMHEELRSLLCEGTSGHRISFGILPETVLRDVEQQRQLIRDHFAVDRIEALPCGELQGGQEFVAAILDYLRNLHASTKQFLTIKPLIDAERMVLDESVCRDLELFETVRRREVEGSLFREINATKTAMGARLLRYDLGHPFLREKVIRERQDATSFLIAQGQAILSQLGSELKACADISRLMTRVLSGRANPTDLLAIKKSLQAAIKLQRLLSSLDATLPHLLSTITSTLQLAAEPLQLLERSIDDHATQLGSLNVFTPGYDKDFDDLRDLSMHGQSLIEEYESKLRLETGINSLKIKEHKSYGLLIEITKSNLTKVPGNFIRRQTMVNNERFVTRELEKLSHELVTAMERVSAYEAELYRKLLRSLHDYHRPIQDLATGVANLDVIQSFASKALSGRFVRPELSENGELRLQACRHPVVERWVGEHAFMPNDVILKPNKKQILITGPNMAGKSTVMRQTAIAAILHQVGSFVPAARAKMPLFDRVFTRVGAADDLSRGQSTFMVEMTEAASILRQASKKSLVILDEVGRGTSTQDGLAIAAAILEHIARELGSYTPFATHYHELVPYSHTLPSVTIGQVEVVEDGQAIRFTHRLVAGASGSSYGVEVAKLAGVPGPVLDQARRFLLEPSLLHTESEAPGKKVPEGAQASQPPLEQKFEAGHLEAHSAQDYVIQTIIERLQRVNVLRTTPLQALAILEELQGYLEFPRQGPLLTEDTYLS